MPNTFTQIHIHLVFAVQNRACLINASWKDELYKYITAIIQNHGHKLLIINGMPDHVHILIGMRPEHSLSGLVQKVKSESSKWINDKKFVVGKFSWQAGYGAFSYGKSQVMPLIKYIVNQEQHHKKKTFREEYLEILNAFEIKYDEKYLFTPIDN
jgi:putative transposase